MPSTFVVTLCKENGEVMEKRIVPTTSAVFSTRWMAQLEAVDASITDEPIECALPYIDEDTVLALDILLALFYHFSDRLTDKQKEEGLSPREFPAFVYSNDERLELYCDGKSGVGSKGHPGYLDVFVKRLFFYVMFRGRPFEPKNYALMQTVLAVETAIACTEEMHDLVSDVAASIASFGREREPSANPENEEIQTSYDILQEPASSPEEIAYRKSSDCYYVCDWEIVKITDRKRQEETLEILSGDYKACTEAHLSTIENYASKVVDDKVYSNKSLEIYKLFIDKTYHAAAAAVVAVTEVDADTD